MSSAEEHKKPRTRSPMYPAIGLKEAIQRAAKLYESADRHAVPVSVATEYWDYKSGSSAGLQIISALKQFGLAIEEGNLDKRTIKLSPLAMKILNLPEDSAEWLELIRGAALRPKIHAELWERYEGKLPADQIIRAYLVSQREDGLFNKTYVDGFIDQFRETITFAKVSNGDIIEEDQDEDSDHTNSGKGGDGKPPRTPLHPKRRQMTTGLKEDVFSLDQGVISVQWPERIQGADEEDIDGFLNTVKKKLKRAIEAAR